MPYFAVLDEGTSHGRQTVGLGTPEQVEKFVDEKIESGFYKPLRSDNLITVTILDMMYGMDGTREVKKMYLWDFEDGAPVKVEGDYDEENV